MTICDFDQSPRAATVECTGGSFPVDAQQRPFDAARCLVTESNVLVDLQVLPVDLVDLQYFFFAVCSENDVIHRQIIKHFADPAQT